MNIKDLRAATGWTQKVFADYFHIPLRTLQNWEGGQRKAPDYLVELMEYKLYKEGIMLSHLEVYNLSKTIKVVPTRLILALEKSEFVKSVEYIKSIKDGAYYLNEYQITVKEMVYTDRVLPERRFTVYAGDHIKNIQDYMPYNAF